MTLNSNSIHGFADLGLLEKALTHKSFFNENRQSSVGHNERLEFLGDAVLDLVLSETLFFRFPHFSEGQLSKVRASLVNESTLAAYAKIYNLQESIKLGKGEAQSGGQEKPRLLASAFEAVIGAVLLDSNYEVTKQTVISVFESRLNEVSSEGQYGSDYKTRLQELIQERDKKTPHYEVVQEDGPDHMKSFEVEVIVGDVSLGRGAGKSKKMAEQEAARLALEEIDT